MNWKNRILYPLVTVIVLLNSCDSFEPDIEPEGEGALDVKNAISALPGTPLFIDLKKSIITSGAVQIQVKAQPSKGSANIEGDAVLRYVPKPEFLSGQDFLSLNLLNSQGSIIDTDSIFINVVQSADSLPCFNGALSDFYSTPQDLLVSIQPIQNDGYCGDVAAGAVIKFHGQPKHGSLEQVALFTYQYQPEAGFTGNDNFMYELELIDLDGNSSFSLAQINIEVHEQESPACDSVIYPFYHALQKPLDEFYIFEPFAPHPSCDISEWSVDSLYVQYGAVEVTENGMIKYFPGQNTDDYISYAITYNGRKDHNYMEISIKEDSASICPEAFDDEYQIYVVGMQDSIATRSDPFVFNPADNDTYCNSNYSINMLEEPDLGVATLKDNQVFEYYVEEEFTGTKTTTIKYEICDAGECSSAYIYLNVHK